MIKTAGANVSPREVEAAIARGHRASSPTSSASTTTTRGQVVAALRAERRRSRVDVDALRAAAHASGSRPTRCRARFLVVPDADVPMMSSGKLDLRALKERLA